MLLHRRCFSSYRAVLSRIGAQPFHVPSDVSLTVEPLQLSPVTELRQSIEKLRGGKAKIHLTQQALIKGPLGTLKVELADFVKVKVAGNQAEVSVDDSNQKHQRAMWGTTRTLLDNAVQGSSEGHLCIVKLVGVGYRAILEDGPDGTQVLQLRLGYTQPRMMTVPEGVEASLPVPHRIILRGCNKQQVKMFAAMIRKHRKPEPYKGKGVYVDDETITLKQKNIK